MVASLREYETWTLQPFRRRGTLFNSTFRKPKKKPLRSYLPPKASSGMSTAALSAARMAFILPSVTGSSV